MKQKPSGFTATCRCGVIVGALDLERTEPMVASKLLGAWLFSGCTVTPFFQGTHCFPIAACKCHQDTKS